MDARCREVQRSAMRNIKIQNTSHKRGQQTDQKYLFTSNMRIIQAFQSILYTSDTQTIPKFYTPANFLLWRGLLSPSISNNILVHQNIVEIRKRNEVPRYISNPRMKVGQLQKAVERGMYLFRTMEKYIEGHWDFKVFMMDGRGKQRTEIGKMSAQD